MLEVQISPYALQEERLQGYRCYVGGRAVSRKPVNLTMAVRQAKALLAGGKAQDIKSYSLSDSDMKRVIPTLKVMSYPELLKAKSLDDVLDEKGRLMLLYLTENQNTGHWVCLLKRANVVEFFDPYGGYGPDGESEWLSEDALEEFGQDTHHLSKLIRASPYKLVVNKTPFQKDKNDNNTCGRHCLCRLYMKHLSLAEYTKMVKGSGVSPDDFVSGFTFHLLRR
jgi:hypothetical protein